MLREAARFIDGLRPDGSSRRSIARSFRAVPDAAALRQRRVHGDAAAGRPQPGDSPTTGRDRFPTTADRFPSVATARDARTLRRSGWRSRDSPEVCAAAVADEIARHPAQRTPCGTGRPACARRARPGDIAILFRSRTSHREFERELTCAGIPTYVYKGLGFFDADEIKDRRWRCSAISPNPGLDLRPRRCCDRVSCDCPIAGARRAGARRLAAALIDAELPPRVERSWTTRIGACSSRRGRPCRAGSRGRSRAARRAARAHPDARRAYAYELRGPRRRQAWENVKKMRGLVRRIQNRGYATMPRMAEH